ncbi:3-phytase A [Metarhizium anisopliae]|nr:3-phytase A [Metarhizium anisopliae]
MGVISNTVASLKTLAGPNHKYRAIPAPVTGRNHAQQVFDERPPRSRFFKLSMSVMLLAVFVFLGFAFAIPLRNVAQQGTPYRRDRSDSESCVNNGSCTHDFRKHWGQYSPYFSAHKGSIKPDIPSGCEVTFASILSRHGSRNPTAGKSKAYKDLVERIQKDVKDYGKGFDKYLEDILVIPEDNGSNNTLDHGTCGAFETGPNAELAHDKQAPWKNIWATPIMERLNAKLPGAKITLEETVYFMDLCPFNTVASEKSTVSDFCRLFSKEEWRGYEYYESLEKWYGYGPANPLGPTQGVGYVNELIARLSHSPVQDHTSTNETLDSNPSTFPLNRLLYADFSHDNTMMTVYAALGIYTNATEIPTDRRVSPKTADGYSASQAVPFGARMYVEKMHCSGDDYEMVRVLVNDRVIPLKGCKADKLGRCEVGDFLKGLDFAKKGGLWDQC